MKNKNRFFTERAASGCVYSAVLIILLLFPCCGGGGGGGGGISGGGSDVYSKSVGPEGGTVTDPNGASVVIPAGALTETTTITIRTYKDSAALYRNFGITPFRGGADFGPDGTTFLKPVTITVPSGNTLQPYQKHALFVYDPDNERWTDTGLSASASGDGTSVIAEVTHFSSYAVLDIGPELLEKFADFWDGGDPTEINSVTHTSDLGNYMNWFLSVTDFFGYKAETDDYVAEVVGIDFNLNTTGGNGYDIEGVMCLDKVTVLCYTFDYMNSEGVNINYHIGVNLYWDVTEVMEKELSAHILEPLPGATVSGLVQIGAYCRNTERVEYFIDGSKVREDSQAPFGWIWDTTALADGSHTIMVKAYDAENNSFESETVTVTVANTTSPAGLSFTDSDIDSGEIGGTVSITKASDESEITHYVLYYGASATIRLGGQSAIATLAKTGSDLTYTIPENTSLPDGASHLLLYGRTAAGDGSPVAIELIDSRDVLFFNPPGGKVTRGTSVSLSTPESGARIYYTLNGKIPDPATSTQYSSPINIEYPTTITAVVQFSDGTVSAPKSHFYWYIPSGTGKIAFSVTDFFEDPDDMYVLGSSYNWRYIGLAIADPNTSGYYIIPDSYTFTAKQFFPEGNTIMGSVYQDNNLCEMNIVTGEQNNITNDSDTYQLPDISLDGTKIVYRSVRDGNWDIYIMDRDGTNKLRLTTHEGNETWPRFSPDGNKILFTSYRDGETKPELYIMDSDGANKQRLTNNSDVYEAYPCFSPDQTKIAYMTNDNIYIMDIDGGNCYNVTNQSTDLGINVYGRGNYFSPDANKLIFQCEISGRSDIYTINIDGSGMTNITGSLEWQNGGGGYTPDGSMVVFWNCPPGGWDIYSISTDGTNPVNLTYVNGERYLQYAFTSR